MNINIEGLDDEDVESANYIVEALRRAKAKGYKLGYVSARYANEEEDRNDVQL